MMKEIAVAVAAVLDAIPDIVGYVKNHRTCLTAFKSYIGEYFTWDSLRKDL